VNRSGHFRAMMARTGSGGRHRFPCGTTTPPSRTPGLPHTAHPQGSGWQSDCRPERSNEAEGNRAASSNARRRVIRPDRDMRQFDGSIV
jgi:hypothetical protein